MGGPRGAPGRRGYEPHASEDEAERESQNEQKGKRNEPECV